MLRKFQPFRSSIPIYPGDKINYNGVIYLWLSENGYKFDDSRIPMVSGWIETVTPLWQTIDYPLWAVVEYEGTFYTLMALEGFDNNIAPLTSDCWGAIADYDSTLTTMSCWATNMWSMAVVYSILKPM